MGSEPCQTVRSISGVGVALRDSGQCLCSYLICLFSLFYFYLLILLFIFVWGRSPFNRHILHMNMMAKLRKFARHKYEEKLTRDVAMIWKKSNCNVEEAMLSRVSLTCKMSKSGDRIQVYESSRDAVLRKVKAERLFSRMLSLQTWSYANGLNW